MLANLVFRANQLILTSLPARWAHYYQTVTTAPKHSVDAVCAVMVTVNHSEDIPTDRSETEDIPTEYVG